MADGKIKVFISYKSGTQNYSEAENLSNYLEKEDFKVFLDQETLHAGRKWNESIYKEISESHVLVVLMTPDAVSDWVQREVDYARGARVSILPVILDEAQKDVIHKDVLPRFALAEVQCVDAFSSIKQANMRYLGVKKSILGLVEDTRAEQKKWVEAITDQWKKMDKVNPDLQPARPKLDYAKYALLLENDLHPCKLYLAAGDMIKLSDIDVLVNSENIYMQMARFFDNRTVSANIRLAGAERTYDRILQDTIQQELDEAVLKWNERGVKGRPVDSGEVFVTTAGHTKSSLVRERRIRYIFHVASVRATIDGGLQPVDENFIQVCVKNCLDKTIEVDTEYAASLPDYKAIESIIFPLIGAGTGGVEPDSAVRAMLYGIKEWLDMNRSVNLKRIYVSAFKQGDVKRVEQIISSDNNFNKIS